ncbi:hypothetical protein Goari_011992 [Gossypium aridum]|uniref:DUF4283 domain-containing protein n=1 Tax=Gossypium aridum TaxID=34290 RepID=A0A7J8X027_GOSAI|nr:hypothetical protein [Gossypium aridum]
MEDELANLNLADEEEDPVQGQEDDEENEEDFSLCMVGRVLTDSAVHFSSMRNILAELWHLIEWVTISKIENKILFHFYNKIDLKRVLDVGFGWNISLKTPPRRKAPIVSRWLREDLKDMIKSGMDMEVHKGKQQM